MELELVFYWKKSSGVLGERQNGDGFGNVVFSTWLRTLALLPGLRMSGLKGKGWEKGKPKDRLFEVAKVDALGDLKTY